MKRCFIFLLFLPTHAFNFIDHKAHGALSEKFMQELVTSFKPDVFFETGTYQGATTRVAAGHFKEVHTVELHKGLYQAAVGNLRSYSNVNLHHGSSPETIAHVGAGLKGTVIFWLDAHYSGEGTALTFANPKAAQAITPIREELAAIKKLSLKNCIILIDDIRGFGTRVAGTNYDGCWAYPMLQDVRDSLYEINPNFKVVLLGDILMAYDATRYTPHLSNTIKACTATRFYTGTDLSNEQLAAAEQVLMSAPKHEKDFIRSLYRQMSQYQDPMFWHDIWGGLVELGAANYKKAHRAFLRVTQKKEPYSHPRIARYLASCTDI